MKRYGYFFCAITIPLLFGCDNSETFNWKKSENYTICFSNREETENFKNHILQFVQQNKLEIFDRSIEAENEMRGIKYPSTTGTLEATALPLIFMTFEKKGWLYITMGNDALGDDLGISFSYNSNQPPAEAAKLIQYFKQKYRYVALTKDGPGSLPCTND